MLWIFFTSALLVCGNAQGQGYDYNRPDKQFIPASLSGFPVSSTPTNAYPSTQPGNGFPSTRPAGFEQTSPQQSGSQILTSQGTGPSRPYPNQLQFPSGQSPGFPSQQPQFPSGQSPGFPSQQPQFPSGQSPTFQSQFPSGQSPGFPSQQSQFPPGQSPGFPSQQSEFPERKPFSGTDKSNIESEQYSRGSQDGQYRGDQEDGDYSAIPGEPDIDYPIYSYIPETSFKCEDQQYPGYYANVETRCQVFHICANNKMYDFLCPNGTVFHQEYLVCVWWNQFDCNSAPSLYGINSNIYDYSQQRFNYPSAPDQNQDIYPGSPQNFVDSRPQSQTFTGPQSYSPELSKTQESGPNQRRPSNNVLSSAQQPDRGYPKLLPQDPGYPQSGPGYPDQQLTTQSQKPSFGRQPTGSGFTPSQPQGFTSPDSGYPGPTSQTSTYPDTGVGYPGSQTSSTFTKPTTPYPSTSYPKPQTPSPGFGSTEFVGSPSYSENEQTNGYPVSGQPFFGANDVQQQRQYLPPVNG